jgi:ATP-dependent Clp protease ATP-binding subunit ClpA
MLLPSYKLLCPNHAIERNFRAVLRMPEPLLQQRIANVKQQCALRESHSSAAAIANSAEVGEEAFYSAASLYNAYLQRWEASQAARGAPFAHLAHLPEHERRRRRKIEQNILSQAEIEELQRTEQQRQLRRKEKRRRDQLTEEEQQCEELEGAAAKRQKQKEAEDAQALAEMNAVGAAAAADVPNAPPPADPWRDVGGLTAQIDSIKECVLLPLLYGELFAQRHISAPKGIVLVGPPGSGKSLLARSLARACSSMVQPTSSSGGRPVSFFARKGADVLSKFHGDAEQTLRSLFDKAERCAPSIIYFVS